MSRDKWHKGVRGGADFFMDGLSRGLTLVSFSLSTTGGFGAGKCQSSYHPSVAVPAQVPCSLKAETTSQHGSIGTRRPSLPASPAGLPGGVSQPHQLVSLPGSGRMASLHSEAMARWALWALTLSVMLPSAFLQRRLGLRVSTHVNIPSTLTAHTHSNLGGSILLDFQQRLQLSFKNETGEYIMTVTFIELLWTFCPLRDASTLRRFETVANFIPATQVGFADRVSAMMAQLPDEAEFGTGRVLGASQLTTPFSRTFQHSFRTSRHVAHHAPG